MEEKPIIQGDTEITLAEDRIRYYAGDGGSACSTIRYSQQWAQEANQRIAIAVHVRAVKWELSCSCAQPWWAACDEVAVQYISKT